MDEQPFHFRVHARANTQTSEAQRPPSQHSIVVTLSVNGMKHYISKCHDHSPSKITLPQQRGHPLFFGWIQLSYLSLTCFRPAVHLQHSLALTFVEREGGAS